jgi:energy-coupling factor transporter ATP-binding protein EcfA2
MPLSPTVRAQLKVIYNALADRVLEPNDPVYVEQVNAQGPSGTDAVSEMFNEIDFQDGGGVCLFTGQRGTGKSTELKRLQAELNQPKTLGSVAYYADLSEYVLLTKPIEISDFLISMAGALSDRVTADDRFDQALAGRGYWQRLSHFLGSTVEFKDVSLKIEGFADLKASLKNDPDFKQRIQSAARGHVAKLVQDAHAFFAEAVEALRAQANNPQLKVVLIVDSIERIRGVGEEAMSVYESVRNLFFAHAEHLRIPGLHVVYTVPPYLSILAAGAGALMGGASVRRLVSTHVFQDRSRAPDDAGVELMRCVLGARFAAWAEVFSQEAVDDLALNSGGDLREFFRLLRQCLPSVRDESQLPLSAPAVQHVKVAARAEMLPIPADHLTWLRQIGQTHDTCLPSDAQLPLLAHFLDNRLVMNYRNGSDWYDVHPLLRDVVDAHVVQPAAA